MNFPVLSESNILTAGNDFPCGTFDISSCVIVRPFRRAFRVSLQVVVTIWNIMLARHLRNTEVRHIIWVFFKKISNKRINPFMAGIDEKTFGYWCWRFFMGIALLNVVHNQYSSVLCNVFSFTYQSMCHGLRDWIEGRILFTRLVLIEQKIW